MANGRSQLSLFTKKVMVQSQRFRDSMLINHRGLCRVPSQAKAGRVALVTQNPSGTFFKKCLFLILFRRDYLPNLKCFSEFSVRHLNRYENNSKRVFCALLESTFKVAYCRKYHANILGLKGIPFYIFTWRWFTQGNFLSRRQNRIIFWYWSTKGICILFML